MSLYGTIHLQCAVKVHCYCVYTMGHSHVYESPPKELMHAISPGRLSSPAAAAVLIISGAAKQDAM